LEIMISIDTPLHLLLQELLYTRNRIIGLAGIPVVLTVGILDLALSIIDV